MGAVRRPRSGSLLLKLTAAYLLPTLGLLAAFGFLAYRVSERSLEESLGQRLIGVAHGAATQLPPESVLFLSPGDDGSRTAHRLIHKLKHIRDRTRVARIFIIDPELRSRADTHAGPRIGDPYDHAKADESELRRVFSGEEAASVLFVGAGGRMYKTGYAPILQDGKAVAAVGVDASAEYYGALGRMRNYLVLSGLVIAVLIVGISILVARRITRPLRQLAREAERIGGGELARPVEVRSGDEVGLLASTMNEMREGLYQRDQHMQMMLSGIAHEVRNPLGGIALFSGLLREDLQNDPEKLQQVLRIERELGYLKKVVEDFLAYARRTPPALQPIDLTQLCGEVCEVLAPDASEKGVELRTDGETGVSASCDPEQMRRVLINLARNAIQATPGGGRVVLRTGQADGACFCEVQDTGSGIPAEILAKVFTPFFTTHEKGTGLGLSLAKKIVEDHGGSLGVESAEQQGTTFRVTLPKGNADGDHSDHR
jgi:signal transduction histidine kinase